MATTIEVDRRPEDVFDYGTDPTRFHEWQRDVVKASWVGEGEPAIGRRFTTTRKIPGGTQTYTQEITEFERPTRWACKGIDGPLRPGASMKIEPLTDGSRSRVTITLGFDPQGAGKLLMPLINRATERQAPRSYQRMKEILEAVRNASDST